MSAFIDFLIVAFWVFLYGFWGGVVGKVMLDRTRSTCPKWHATVEARKNGTLKHMHGYEMCEADDHIAPYLAAAFWPIALPTVIGFCAAGWFSTDGKERREEAAKRKHDREMERLKAETERNKSAARIVEEFEP